MIDPRLGHVRIRDSRFEIENKMRRIGNMLSYPESAISTLERVIINYVS